MNPRENTNPALTPIITLVLWGSCFFIGALGLALPYPLPALSPKTPPPVKATLLNVELTTQPIPPRQDSPPPKLSEPPPLVPPPPSPPAPPMAAVAEPNPNIAFALPVEGPARIVSATQADAKRPAATPAATTTPQPQTLVFGQGEGKQPAPEYPRRAQREGQEGTVNILFSVDQNGRVVEAQVSRRSPWPLLNEAALTVVREQWRFQSGPVRLYEVPIKFELEK